MADQRISIDINEVSGAEDVTEDTTAEGVSQNKFEELLQKMGPQTTKQSKAKIDKAKKKEKAVTDFQEELKTDFDEIKVKVEQVRGKILSRIGFDGCLRGSVDDYLDTYDSQIEKVNKKLGMEKRYWSNQARQINMLKQKQES